MTSRRFNPARIWCAVLATVLLGLTVHGATVWQCDGSRVRRSNPVVVRTSAVGFPDGWVWTDALLSVLSHWNNGPSAFSFDVRRGDTSVGVDNGQNELWWTDDAEVLKGLPAITKTIWNGCNMVEADVVFDVSEPYWYGGDYGAVFAYLRFYGGEYTFFDSIAMHELGHVAALAHENRFYNLMGHDQTHVHSHSLRVRAYTGSDANHGMVVLYGEAADSVDDISVSHYKWIGDSSMYSDTDEYSIHARVEVYDLSGNSLPSYAAAPPDPDPDRDPRHWERTYWIENGVPVVVEFTYENTGSVHHPMVEARFFLSNDRNIEPPDRALSPRLYLDMPSISLGTMWSRVNLPDDLPPDREYFLGPRLGVLPAMAEADEENNATYVRVRVAPADLDGLALWPNPVIVPATVNGRVDLTGAAHPGGVTVALRSTNSLASVPASVEVPAGEFSAGFEVQIDAPFCPPGRIEIEATLGATTRRRQLTILYLQPADGEGVPWICLEPEPGVWFDFIETIHRCIDPPKIPGEPPRRCGAPPDCPDCLFTLAGRRVTIPDYLDDLLGGIDDVVLPGVGGPDWPPRVREIAELLRRVPRGPHFDERLRRSALEAARAMTEIGHLTRKRRNALVEAANAVELDVRMPSPTVVNPRLAGNGRSLDFGGVTTVWGMDGESHVGLELHVEAGLPAPLSGFQPTWPAVTYRFDGPTRAPGGGLYEVGINLWGLGAFADASTLRVLEWDGKRYHDVTGQLDLVDGRIYALTENLSTLVVVSRGSELRGGRPGTGGMWSTGG